MLLSKVLMPFQSAFSISLAGVGFKAAVLNIEGPGSLNDLFNNVSLLCSRHFLKKEMGLSK